MPDWVQLTRTTVCFNWCNMVAFNILRLVSSRNVSFNDIVEQTMGNELYFTWFVVLTKVQYVSSTMVLRANIKNISIINLILLSATIIFHGCCWILMDKSEKSNVYLNLFMDYIKMSNRVFVGWFQLATPHTNTHTYTHTHQKQSTLSLSNISQNDSTDWQKRHGR